MALKPRHKAFLEALLADPKHRPRQAALAAGVSEGSAKTTGRRWSKLPEVAAALELALTEPTQKCKKATDAGSTKFTEKDTKHDTCQRGTKKEPTAPAGQARRMVGVCQLEGWNEEEHPEETVDEQGFTLSPAHDRFAREYIVDDNATRAYMRVYPRTSYAAAKVSAHKLLTNPNISARVAELREARSRRLNMTADDVYLRIARIASADIRDLQDADGRYLPLSELDPDTAAAIASVTTRHHIVGEEKDGIAVITSVKLADPLRALELLGRKHKMFTDRIEQVTDESYMKAIDEAEAAAERELKGGKADGN